MSALERRLAKLTLVVLATTSGRTAPAVPGFDNGRLEVLFNPTDYSIDRDTTFAEVAIPGLDSPVIQYVRGNGDKMTFELFLDITDTMQDGQVVTGDSVRELFVDPLEQLLLKHPELHAPPPVMVLWGNEVVMESAVATSLSVKYTLFDTSGRPVRATASLSLREYRTATAQLATTRENSPDVSSLVIVREGDTLPAIAFRAYGDAAQWRPIADANPDVDPLALVPGQGLVVPPIMGAASGA